MQGAHLMPATPSSSRMRREGAPPGMEGIEEGDNKRGKRGTRSGLNRCAHGNGRSGGWGLDLQGRGRMRLLEEPVEEGRTADEASRSRLAARARVDSWWRMRSG
jgi:hypothetical protein